MDLHYNIGFGFIIIISVIKPDPVDCFRQHDQRIVNNNKVFGKSKFGKLWHISHIVT